MKGKSYWDAALLIVMIFGGLGVFIFIQQHAPATEPQKQEAAEQTAPRGCGAATVEGEGPQATAGGCCGTAADDTTQSEDVSQQTQPQDMSKTVPQTPKDEDANEDGCGCGG